MTARKDKIVLVEWLDACGGERRGWRPMKEVQAQEPAKCQSVGFLVRKTKTEVVVCPHLARLGDDVDGDAELAIPRSWVKKIKVLK